MEQPDLADPAVCFAWFGEAVFRPFLEQGSGGPFGRVGSLLDQAVDGGAGDPVSPGQLAQAVSAPAVAEDGFTIHCDGLAADVASFEPMVATRLKANPRSWKLYTIGAGLDTMIGSPTGINQNTELAIHRRCLAATSDRLPPGRYPGKRTNRPGFSPPAALCHVPDPLPRFPSAHPQPSLDQQLGPFLRDRRRRSRPGPAAQHGSHGQRRATLPVTGAPRRTQTASPPAPSKRACREEKAAVVNGLPIVSTK